MKTRPRPILSGSFILDCSLEGRTKEKPAKKMYIGTLNICVLYKKKFLRKCYELYESEARLATQAQHTIRDLN